MQLPLQITFRDIPHSPAIEAAIRAKAAKLDQYYGRVMNCRVMVEAPHTHHHKGKLYHVRIDLTVPDGELVVSRNPGKDPAHADAYVAVRDAFDAAYRQLKAYAEKRRGETKGHEPPPHGRILEIYPEQGFGRILTPEGREIYFHENAVVDYDFAKLREGMEVRFAEEEGDKGPQASTVHVVGKHHVVA